jgi:alpha-D-ribose 1-methylphosphonate 5-triphosphate synthase subunit PhnI
MAYVAVKGGKQAIEASLSLLELERVDVEVALEVLAIKEGMKGLIDQVMSESSLYDRDLAALALKQAQGSMEEAVFLLRAHRSTLPRTYYTRTCEAHHMTVKRRISSSFKDIPGGQLLGSTPDFSQRFLNKELVGETLEELREKKQELSSQLRSTEEKLSLINIPRVSEQLEREGLIEKKQEDNSEPGDITKRNVRFPASRSERLQSLTRGQTGAVTSLGYAAFRSHGVTSHPNIGELRVGELPLTVSMDETDSEAESYYIGSIEVTEVVTFVAAEKKSDSKEETAKKMFDLGYGMCMGQNETKAIAMSILDFSLEHPTKGLASSDEEFVLLHIDSVESTGFISHLKLPHYVTFQSSLDSVRKGKKGEKKA